VPVKSATSKQFEAPRQFELIAGHPALDFVNTLDDRFEESGPVELLANYDDLLRFVSQAGLIAERQFRELKNLKPSPAKRSNVLADAVRLREALAAILYAVFENKQPPKAALLNLETIFKRAAGHRNLSFKRIDSPEFPTELSWEYEGIGKDIQSPLWLLAQAANDLLTSPQVGQIRKCASSTCQWLFLDTSKNHTRRWCDMKICGNRNKARLFHLRQGSG
jgi:predicted RNA-binding Zn ribbon-like protein